MNDQIVQKVTTNWNNYKNIVSKIEDEDKREALLELCEDLHDRFAVAPASTRIDYVGCFVGGFVDPSDASYEHAAYRELQEETGGNLDAGTAKSFKYITSQKIDDWRYRKEESGIMTTLFLAKRNHGYAKASDDIAVVEWIPIREFSNFHGIRTQVMIEHRELMQTLVDRVYPEKLIPNIGERKAEEEGNIIYTAE
jgi:ADP-ribose pyrophosphatase YjhB (NUDIX family)